MSRRFGRNQKRRLREELAQAESASETAMRMSAERGRRAEALSAEANELRRMIADVAARVGHYAIVGAEPQEYEADWLRRGVRRFEMHVTTLPPSTVSYGTMEKTTVHYTETMRLLEADAVRDDFSREMHCRVTFGEHDIGYAISDRALYRLTAAEIERRIAPEITRLLIKELKVRQ